jgi:mannose-6-phosphate isomerase-like protein (cupin superfamily)
MITKYNLFDIGGEVIKDDEYGIVRENKQLGTVWINSFLLYKDKSTKKIIHPCVDCIFIFVDGKGVLELGKDIIYVGRNDIVLIPHNSYHRIINNGDIHMKFLILKEKV